MNENFERETGRVGGGGEFGEFPKGEFPREDGEVKALASGEGNAFGRGEGHLGGGVEFDFRTDGPGEADEAEVLDNQGVDRGLGSSVEESLRLRKLRRKDKNIHREVAPSAPGVEVIHDLWEVFLGEVFRPETGVEGGQSEIDGIGTGDNGGLEAVPVASGGKEFGPWTHE